MMTVSQASATDLESHSDFTPEPKDSTIQQSSILPDDLIPNGGTVAWLQVLGSFLLFLNTWGLINSYGVYQTYYEEDILSSSTSSAISWIGSVQSFLIMLCSIFTGPLFDAGYLRALLCAGTFFVVFGHMMLSLCNAYWQIFLAQAVCVGFGGGLLFVPSVAILPTYFTTRMSSAIGIAAAGSSLGGVIYPILLHRLLPMIGFGWAARVLGFFALTGLLIPNLVMKTRVKPAAQRKKVDLAAFRELPFITFISGIFIAFLGLYVPFYFVQLYSIDKGIADANMAFYIVPIINGASMFGRILPNFIADKFGALNILLPCAFASGISILLLIGITKSLAGLLVVCAFYGFVSGTFVSLMPSVIHAITANKSLIATRMGMYFMIIAFSLLFGTPIGGAVLGGRGYMACWVYGGILTLFGSCLMVSTKFFVRHQQKEII